MTDLEITKKCAEAIGLGVDQPMMNGVGWICSSGDCYNPLHDDAQAMALVKKFGIQISKTGCIWYAMSPLAESSDLNRAICECVAKL